MKKALIFILVGLLAGAALMYFVGPGRFPNRMKPAEPTSFGPVASRLDSGGDLYAFYSTDRLIRSILGLAGKLSQTVPLPKEGDEAAAVSFLFRLLAKSGLTEISGVGVSNVPIASGLQRTKMVVYHDPKRNTGLLWQVAQTGPRTLTELTFLPADTALSAFNEFRLDQTWTWLKKEMETSGVPDIQKFVGQVEPTLAAQGLDLPKLLGSLTGSFGYIVTLSKEKTISLPENPSEVTIPEPGLAVVLGTRDTQVFDTLKAKLTMAVFSDKDGRNTLQFSPIPAPIPLEPCIMQADGFLIVASTPTLADSLLKARAGNNGLAAEAEFKQLAGNVPARGNGFVYLSPRLWGIYADLIDKAAVANPDDKKAQNILFAIFPRDMKAFSVMEQRFDGFVWTSCHNLPAETMLLAPFTAVAGMASAMILPNIAKVGEKAKVNGTIATLKTVGTALETYMVDHGDSPRAEAFADLQSVLAPAYIKELPLTDAWGNNLLYRKTGPSRYMIASPGKDGVFNGWEQKGEYAADQINEDIIFSGLDQVYGPAAGKM